MMRGSIAVRLMGGLGNQLFQYAAGSATAQACGARLLLDLSHFADPGGGRRYELGSFAIEADLMPWPTRIHHAARIVSARPSYEELCTLLRQSPSAALRRALSPASWRRFRLVAESGFDFSAEALATARPKAYLFGYWQSERYFLPIAPALRRTFRTPRAIDARNRPWLARIQGATGAVCVHVRRGDYLRPDTAAVHGLCSLAYFRRAMDHIRERVAGAAFFVFSDDRAWALANLAGPDATVVDANDADAAAQELMLMAACRHHIIANSSLSWWAAWLAQAAGQIVIAPTPWFAHGRPTPDLLPATWITLPRD